MALVGIVMLPFYVDALGLEAYGLIGLFIALQTWLALLDLGISAALSREAARFRGGAADADSVWSLLRFAETSFLALGLVIALSLAAGAPAIAGQWLNEAALDHGEVVQALRLIGVVLALRFLAIPYRATLTGLEDLAWLGGANAVVTTVRSVLVLLALALFGASLTVFFLWQLAIGIGEVALLYWRTRRLLTPVPAAPGSRRSAFARHWRFSLGMASASAIWVAATSADRIIVSGLLPLRDYSLFSIAVTAAGGVMLIVAPFALALGPRISRLHAGGDRPALIAAYAETTQLTAVAAFPVALVLALFASQVLWAWTGKEDIASDAAGVLALYALGNALLTIGALPLQLQVAAGQLRLHVLGTILFVALLLPLLWWWTGVDGMEGAGRAWLAVNLAFVAFWVPVAHRRFLPAPHWRWLGGQVLAVLLPTAAAALLLKLLLPWPDERLPAILQLGAVGAVLLGVAAASASNLRGHFRATARQLAGALR